jgi:hypothetical protein
LRYGDFCPASWATRRRKMTGGVLVLIGAAWFFTAKGVN